MRIEAEGLRFSYPRAARPALDGASIELAPGEAVALLGPNGSGKSTLLAALLGLHRPSAGRVLADGRDLAGLSPRERSRLVAWLPQFERLGFSFSALEYVLIGRAPEVAAFGSPSRADEARALGALEEAGAAELAGRAVNELSGGELQLVRVARCLAQETPAILMDEPTAMLDPLHARRVADTIGELVRAGRTIAFSTHDPAFAAFAAGRAVLMRGGRDIFRGPVAEALEPARLEACFGLPFVESRAPSAFAPRLEAP